MPTRFACRSNEPPPLHFRGWLGSTPGEYWSRPVPGWRITRSTKIAATLRCCDPRGSAVSFAVVALLVPTCVRRSKFALSSPPVSAGDSARLTRRCSGSLVPKHLTAVSSRGRTSPRAVGSRRLRVRAPATVEFFVRYWLCRQYCYLLVREAMKASRGGPTLPLAAKLRSPPGGPTQPRSGPLRAR
jgi:hypothetical protein